jgi:hypothetical protein
VNLTPVQITLAQSVPGHPVVKCFTRHHLHEAYDFLFRRVNAARRVRLALSFVRPEAVLFLRSSCGPITCTRCPDRTRTEAPAHTCSNVTPARSASLRAPYTQALSEGKRYVEETRITLDISSGISVWELGALTRARIPYERHWRSVAQCLSEGRCRY